VVRLDETVRMVLKVIKGSSVLQVGRQERSLPLPLPSCYALFYVTFFFASVSSVFTSGWKRWVEMVSSLLQVVVN
jgi:hypothetical protein